MDRSAVTVYTCIKLEFIAYAQIFLVYPVVLFTEFFIQAPVLQKVHSAIHHINLYPVASAIGFPLLIHWKEICPMDSATQHLNNWGVVKRLRRLLDTL